MKNQWHLIGFAFAAAIVLYGTFATSPKAYTRHGVHLSAASVQMINSELVKAWNPDDATLVRQMREYLKSLAK